jgi:hypothetical protein
VILGMLGIFGSLGLLGFVWMLLFLGLVSSPGLLILHQLLALVSLLCLLGLIGLVGLLALVGLLGSFWLLWLDPGTVPQRVLPALNVSGADGGFNVFTEVVRAARSQPVVIRHRATGGYSLRWPDGRTREISTGPNWAGDVWWTLLPPNMKGEA